MKNIHKQKVRTGVLLTAAAILTATFSQQIIVGQLAGTGSTNTGSGTVVETVVVQELTLEEVQRQVAMQQWSERTERAGFFREEMLKARPMIESMQVVEKVTREKRAELRALCREDIRKASKYTKLEVTEQCYAKELELEQEFLVKQRDFILQVPGISADIRSLSETRINLLYDSLGVVVNAIYSKVYESTAELEEVKSALRTNYRVPKWLMDVRREADILLTRTSSIIIRIGEIAENEEANEETSNALLETLVCFTNAETQLKNAVRSTELDKATENFTIAKEALYTCSQELKIAAETLEAPTKKTEVVTGSGDTVAEDTSVEDVILHGSAPERSKARTASDKVRIHGLTSDVFVEATYEKTIVDTEGYQADGPTPPEPCNLETQDRVLQGAIKEPCRIHDYSYLQDRGFVPSYFKVEEPEPERVLKEKPEPKESVTGPSAYDCNTEGLPRRLWRRITNNECRINEEFDMSDRGFKPSAYAPKE